jgi:hypothetical protein
MGDKPFVEQDFVDSLGVNIIGGFYHDSKNPKSAVYLHPQASCVTHSWRGYDLLGKKVAYLPEQTRALSPLSDSDLELLINVGSRSDVQNKTHNAMVLKRRIEKYQQGLPVGLCGFPN